LVHANVRSHLVVLFLPRRSELSHLETVWLILSPALFDPCY